MEGIKKNVLRKDFFMEIRKSLGRFLSIFFIVALGVSLFVGISATQSDMIQSGDAYADEQNLMDIKIIGSMGLTEEDVTEIEKLSSIEQAIGSYSTDALCPMGENKGVLHIMSLTEGMNEVTLAEGRMPVKENECFVDQDFMESAGYEIGDTLMLTSGTEEELKETLKHTELIIVGSGHSPLYYAFERGSSTIGNGTVAGFLVVQPELFELDVYTEIFAFVKGAKEVWAFTEEYESLTEEAMDQVESIQEERYEARRNSLVGEAMEEVDEAQSELDEEKAKAEKEISDNEARLLDAQAEIDDAEKQIKDGRKKLSEGWSEIHNGKSELESGRKELEDGKKELEASRGQLEEGIAKMEAEKAKLQAQLDQINAGLPMMDPATQAAMAETIAKLEGGIAQIDEQMISVQAEFAAGEAKIIESEKLLAESEAELLKGEQELVKSEEELKKAERELADGKKELAEGKEELAEAKVEFEEEIADAQEEIDDAIEEINDIDMPEWYLFDRDSIPEYTGYGDNAARIAALSIVFPSIFFLVAALISLTTMTRMVEEQRVQIGTLKALGYSTRAIMGKYMNYALAATLGGSVFGVLVGEKLFPYVIIAAYHMTVYTHLPYIMLPYQWGYAIVATLVAVFCTCGAAMSACYKELLAQPAILMRPEAPKIGKRTFVEKIPFLWKHLNFSWKSTLRNLFRYKKRFFMTLFGIGGCMGLLMVGFGLRDSITSIADYQYGELHLYDSSIFIADEMESEEREELMTYLKGNQDLDTYMNGYMTSLTAKNGKEKVDVYLTVMGEEEKTEEFFVFRDRKTKERYALSDEGVILTEKTAEMLGVKAGDQIEISEEEKNKHIVTVLEICENYAGHYMYMTEAGYEHIYGEKPVYNNVFMKVKEDIPEGRLEEIGEEILEFEDILNVQYTENLSGQLKDMLVALDKVMIVLITVAGMLSFVVLYNLNNINITERRRELATLKVLGFYDGEVANYVYRENIFLTIFGVIVGCFIGRALHYFTIVTVEVDAAMFGREVFFMSYVYCALFTIGFSAFVNWMMYFKLKKIDMVESLKSVE